MIQILIDLTDFNTLTALYISIYIGMTIKLLWAWSAESSFLGSITDTANTKIVQPFFYNSEKSNNHSNHILMWIIKYIRRKKSSQDGREEHSSFLLYTL
ncbi:hypothetical protein [Neobacillus terrae]|uniref:hypothetical protein n=1 Tax=Neobacillus terrae TaxID=3034837 RepID=UPI00140E37A9|nr:hypothetical protein [Neobacillus terrae]NHM29405.1 hypothetical protein [Neobacillus terrae]